MDVDVALRQEAEAQEVTRPEPGKQTSSLRVGRAGGAVLAPYLPLAQGVSVWGVTLWARTRGCGSVCPGTGAVPLAPCPTPSCRLKSPSATSCNTFSVTTEVSGSSLGMETG